MLSIKAIKKGLEDRNLSAVARKTGLNYQTVVLFCKEANYNSSYRTVEKLSAYVEGSQKTLKGVSNDTTKRLR